MATVWFWLVQVGTVMQENNGNSSAQDFAFTEKNFAFGAKFVRTCEFSQGESAPRRRRLGMGIFRNREAERLECHE